MNKKIFISLMFLIIFLMTVGYSLAATEEKIVSYHGADSVFRKEGITIIWALLKGENITDSLVYIKLITTEEVRNKFKYYSLKASDPFSDKVQWLISGEELKEKNFLILKRDLFEVMTAREILFYKNFNKLNQQENKAFLSIYYLSLPDTTPEFTDLGQLVKYLEDAEKRLNQVLSN